MKDRDENRGLAFALLYGGPDAEGFSIRPGKYNTNRIDLIHSVVLPNGHTRITGCVLPSLGAVEHYKKLLREELAKPPKPPKKQWKRNRDESIRPN